jgi:hypothetical protein
MNEEAELIVKAIESHRVESTWFKGYLFPIVSGFFSGILGAFIAYLALENFKDSHFLKSYGKFSSY